MRVCFKLWSLQQDLVSKNEALRRQLHEVQLHCEQQLKAKEAAAQEEERRRSQIYQKAMDEAKQLNAELMVGLFPFPAVNIFLLESYTIMPGKQRLTHICTCCSEKALFAQVSTLGLRHILLAGVKTAHDAAA